MFGGAGIELSLLVMGAVSAKGVGRAVMRVAARMERRMLLGCIEDGLACVGYGCRCGYEV